MANHIAVGLPPAVLAVLPSDTKLQLELAYKITCYAYTQQVSQLEVEAQQMQETVAEHQHVMRSLERRIAGMESELREQQQKARQCLTEQHKLVAEKNALIETVKRLNREVVKLEHFKRNLLQQLQEDNEPDSVTHTLAAVDLTTERLVNKVLQSADGIAAATAAAAAAAASGGQGLAGQELGHKASPPRGPAGSLYAMQRSTALSSSPLRSLYAAAGSPGNTKGAAAAAAAAGARAADVGRAREASLHSPAKNNTSTPVAAQQANTVNSVLAGEGYGAGQLSSNTRFASPRPAGGASSGAAAGRTAGAGGSTSPRLDGKQFFRQARACLSYEQFSRFLVAIKELNAGRASREATLETAKQLFGPSNADLYGSFESLLLRHLTSL